MLRSRQVTRMERKPHFTVKGMQQKTSRMIAVEMRERDDIYTIEIDARMLRILQIQIRKTGIEQNALILTFDPRRKPHSANQTISEARFSVSKLTL